MDEEARVCRDLGHRIIELRRTNGLTQEQLAERLHVDARELRRIEAGGNTTVQTLVRIARAFGVGVPELFVAPKTRSARDPGRPPTVEARPRKKAASRASTEATPGHGRINPRGTAR